MGLFTTGAYALVCECVYMRTCMCVISQLLCCFVLKASLVVCFCQFLSVLLHSNRNIMATFLSL